MRVFRTRAFARFQRRERIADTVLCDTVERMEDGLVQAALGGELFKERMARPGQGKRGGYRVLLGWRKGERAVFVYGFAKKDADNIADDDLEAWKMIGSAWLGLSRERIERAIADDDLAEVYCG